MLRTFCIALFACAGLASCATDHAARDHQHTELPAGSYADDSLYQLDSAWISDYGNSMQLGDLAPHPVVTAMIYTSCEYACPLIVGKMLALYDQLDENVRSDTRFVLFSFDPERDTPDKLKPYKRSQHIDKPEWLVLTADDEAALELAVALGVRYKPIANGDFAHSNVITVLDRSGVPVHQMARLDEPEADALEAIRNAYAN